jgi:hypothetical protein
MPNDRNNRPGFLQHAKGQVTLLIVAAIVVVFLSMGYIFCEVLLKLFRPPVCILFYPSIFRSPPMQFFASRASQLERNIWQRPQDDCFVLSPV